MTRLVGCSAVSCLTALLVVWPGAATAQSVSGARAEESRTLALATQMERSGQSLEAERLLIELLASQPTAAQALSMLARLTLERGAPDVVLPYAEEAAERAGFDQAVVHQTLIRALAASGLGEEALQRAREWIARRPSDLTGYAELSTTLSTLGRSEDAVSVLLDARGRTSDEDVFSQELAVLYESAGDYERAAGEWLRVLAWGDAGVAAIEARLRTPGVDDDALLDGLASALERPSSGVAAIRGGLDLAVELDRFEWARRLAGKVAERAPRDTRWHALRKYYLAVRDAGRAEDARWAAGRLAAEAADPGDRLEWEAVEASLALQLGDDDHARTAFGRISEQAERGSETRRLALYSLVLLRIEARPSGAAELIERFEREFPDREAELADLAIRLSRARVGSGDLGAARAALDLGPANPRDASTASRLEAQRGDLALFEGRIDAARSHLETAGYIPGGDPGQRTEILLFLDVFGRADSTDVVELGKGIYALHSGGGPDRLLRASNAWAGASAREPAAAAGLMRLAANALERAGRPDEASTVRERLVAAYPSTAEAPGALLALARTALPGRPAEARTLLQRLIIDHPASALAPVARRLLAELDDQVPSSEAGRS